jgi:3-isopropylmalate/(R)-2-methylmalate dehydratase small subunit
MKEITEMTANGIIRGRVWKFGDNISTTDIMPGEMFMNVQYKPKEIAFAALNPEWRSKVKPGDCIVAGDNFGFGSHRAPANDVMNDLGIGCIVANSIARIYYRQAIAIGFPAFPCPGVSSIFNDGDEMELNINLGLVKNLTSGESIQGRPYPRQLLEILEAGGMMPSLVERVHSMNKT